MTPQIQLIVLYTQRIVQLPKLRITYYLNKCLDPLDCTVLGPRLEFCITYYLNKCYVKNCTVLRTCLELSAVRMNVYLESSFCIMVFSNFSLYCCRYKMRCILRSKILHCGI